MNKLSDLLVAFEEYLTVIKGVDSSTIDAYLMDLSQLEVFSQKALTALETVDVLAFLSEFKNKRTLNRKLSSINAFFNFCHKYDFSHEKVHIPMAKIPKLLPKYISNEAILDGINLIDKKKLIGLRDYALILFLYASGCRISEALKVQRMDIVEGWLRIRFAKGEKERVVPLAPVAQEALARYLKAQDIASPYIWLNYRGGQLSRISAFKIVKKYLGVSPHVLRHSFATSLIVGGADLSVVQELLGHASLETTQIYTHLQQEHLSATMSAYHPLA